MKLTSLAAAAIMSLPVVQPVHAAPLVFDLATSTLTVPELSVGGTVYSAVFRYDSDGRLSITSLAPASTGGDTNTSSGVCTAANFSSAIFNRITVGMTLTQVQDVIGCAYDPSRIVRVGTSTQYSWRYVASPTILFINGVFDASGLLMYSPSSYGF